MNVAQHRCLTLLASCKTLKTLNIIHAQVLKTGLDSDLLIAGELLSHCSVHLSNALDYAFRLVFTTPNPDVFMYNTLIRGYSKSESPANALSIFIHMLRCSNSVPDSFSYTFVLKAVGNMRCVRSGFQLHCQAICRGFQTHLFVGTTLVSMYAECGCVEFAHKSFDEIPEPNVVAWNAMLTAYFRCNDLKGVERTYNLMPFRDLTSLNLMLAEFIKAGELKSAKEYFSEMSITDDVSWSTMIIGFAHNGCFHEAICYFIELLKVGKNPNEVSLTGVLFACAQAGMLDLSKILHGFLEKTGLIWIVSVNNALLDAYSKCGDVEIARLVFDRFPGKRSIVSWGSMIAGLAMQGLAEEALRLFVQMENSGVRPDGITFISVLYACSHAGLVEKGDEIFSRMTQEYGIEPELEHYGCMVDLYGRAGELQKAYNFIIQMPIAPNSIIWRTLLGACSFFGDTDLAELVKKKLTELDPWNPSDHVLLSNIYAVSGKWKDVATIRRSMREMKMKKTPGWSMVEVDKILYTFVAGTESKSEVNDEAYKNLMEIIQKLRVEGGYVPEVGGVFRDIEEEEKENAVSTHSEKLAVAFAIGRSFRGRERTRRTIIRIVKNLRVCKDCHTLMKLISKVYQLEIVVRDRSRFHSFKEGSCSCRDYW